MRGCRGLLITQLNEDGTSKDNPTTYWIDTSQEASVESEIMEGESSDLRGGDHLLVRVEDQDTTIGVNLSFTDARFDAGVLEVVSGGTLILDGTEIVGWVAPKIADQTVKNAFRSELYVQSFNSEGSREAFLRYSFPYCIGSTGSITHTDQDWGTPEFSVKARENGATGESAYSKEFVADYPRMITLTKAGTGTGTIKATLDPDATPVTTIGAAIPGDVITVTIDTAGTFGSIAVVDAASQTVATTTVTLGEEYTFVMPSSAAAVTVTLNA